MNKVNKPRTIPT